jgi:hypothetical protein
VLKNAKWLSCVVRKREERRRIMEGKLWRQRPR